MEHFIKDLHIENFKSIKKMDIKPNRINVFVGRPNVGKSNILEGLSLLGLGNSYFSDENYLKDRVRFSSANELFYQKDITQKVHVYSDKLFSEINNIPASKTLFFYILSNERFFLFSNDDEFLSPFDETNYSKYPNFSLITYEFKNNTNKVIRRPSDRYEIREHSIYFDIKYYLFKKDIELKRGDNVYLESPFGNNLTDIIEIYSPLRKECVSIFNDYNLQLFLGKDAIQIQKLIDGIAHPYSYELVADTLQRYIFHSAAIASNKNSVLLFEEPEAHCYYEYVINLAEKIIESETNQFFLTTHSNDVLNTLIARDLKNEVNIYHVEYDNDETVVRLLDDGEMDNIRTYGLEVISNLENIKTNA